MSLANPTSKFRSFFDAIGGGQSPADHDLEAEGFPREQWAAVRRQVREIHSLRADGQLGDARRHARDLAEDWARRLPDATPARRELPSDPRGLADLVRPT